MRPDESSTTFNPTNIRRMDRKTEDTAQWKLTKEKHPTKTRARRGEAGKRMKKVGRNLSKSKSTTTNFIHSFPPDPKALLVFLDKVPHF
jgi:hypothetical protein